MTGLHLKDNTILITGGASGIGLELTKTLFRMGNTMIICGRSEEKLQQVKRELPQVHILQCDISDQNQRKALFSQVTNEHPGVNILVNNAVIVSYTRIQAGDYSAGLVNREMQTNFIGPVGLITLFLDQLKRQQNSAIINMTTGLIFAPHATMPGYCASKAALHSFTQSLRIQLKDTPVKVIEVMMTAVDTHFHDGGHVPDIAITTDKAVAAMVKGLLQSQEEIKIGRVRLLSILSRIAPHFALNQVNKL
ncbi:MAG: SDR family NAD(P)-dependent oxidoreductase [Desulfobacteraceae bacterium]|nr:SDR family NAD(P)-dependent oxidoreductase [Desulfobacteraceae bacterium]